MLSQIKIILSGIFPGSTNYCKVAGETSNDYELPVNSLGSGVDNDVLSNYGWIYQKDECSDVHFFSHKETGAVLRLTPDRKWILTQSAERVFVPRFAPLTINHLDEFSAAMVRKNDIAKEL